MQRARDILERGTDRGARHVQHVGNLTDRLEPGQDVSGCGRKKGIGIEKIGPAEHVEHRGPARAQLRARPGADFRELGSVERAEGPIEKSGMLQPALIPRERRERRLGGRLHAGEETRGIIGAGGRGQARHRAPGSLLGRRERSRAPPSPRRRDIVAGLRDPVGPGALNAAGRRRGRQQQARGEKGSLNYASHVRRDSRFERRAGRCV